MAHKNLYDIQDDKIVRKKRHCPKCGEGTFMAQHKDRETCGHCQYTEFTKKEEPPTAKAPKDEKPAE